MDVIIIMKSVPEEDGRHDKDAVIKSNSDTLLRHVGVDVCVHGSEPVCLCVCIHRFSV